MRVDEKGKIVAEWVYRAIPCSCGYRACKAWMVDPVAAVQCVHFTRKQAEAVAQFLNEHPELESE